MSRVYLDASTIIYLVEAESPFHAAATQSVARFRNDPESQLVTSRLSCLECRTKPIREADVDLVAKYDAFFRQRRLVVVEVTAAIIERATLLRARDRFKTPDAIHIATAIEEKADLFLTGDEDLKRCSELTVDILCP